MMRYGLTLALAAFLLLPVSGAMAGDEDRTAWEKRLDALDAEDAASAFKLALQLEAKGHDDLASKAYEIVIGIEPNHIAARRALGYEKINERWHTGDGLMRAKGFIHHGGDWITSEQFAEATRPQREAAEQKAGEKRVYTLLQKIASEDEETVAKARRQMALEEDRFKLAQLAKCLRCEPASLRIYCAQELGRLDDPLAVPALLKRAIYDPDEKVRDAVVMALKDIGEPSTVHPLGRALDSRYSEVRVNAAEALGKLGDELGLGYVIKKWEGRSGDFPQVYFMSAAQLSYIQDFDVEVAQTSFIADPIVGVIQEGVVQSVKILATVQTFTTVERAAYKGAVNGIVGTDMGDDVKAWSKFWRENANRLIEERNMRYQKIAEQRKMKKAGR